MRRHKVSVLAYPFIARRHLAAVSGAQCVSGRHCARCGDFNAHEANFCRQCGALLEAKPPQARASSERFALRGVTVTRWELVVVRGGGIEGRAWSLNRSHMTIGRATAATISLDDITVSPRHAVLDQRDETGHTLIDCGSVNGTCVNRERVELALLNDGDSLQIGKYRLTYRRR